MRSFYKGLSDERRKTDSREAIECIVRIKPRDRNFFESIVRDLSVSGFRVNCPADLIVGTSIMVTFPGMEMLPAVVRWKKGFEYGCSFERSLYPAVFEHIVKQQRS